MGLLTVNVWSSSYELRNKLYKIKGHSPFFFVYVILLSLRLRTQWRNVKVGADSRHTCTDHHRPLKHLNIYSRFYAWGSFPRIQTSTWSTGSQGEPRPIDADNSSVCPVNEWTVRTHLHSTPRWLRHMDLGRTRGPIRVLTHVDQSPQWMKLRDAQRVRNMIPAAVCHIQLFVISSCLSYPAVFTPQHSLTWFYKGRE